MSCTEKELETKASPPPSSSVKDSISPAKVIKQILSSHKLLLERTGDIIINFLVIFPCTIGFWRGIWQLLDCYLVNYENLDPWISLAFGYTTLILLYSLQVPLRSTINPDHVNIFSYNFLPRLIILLHSTADVNQWRGVWKLYDIYFGTDLNSALVSLLVGLAASLPFKTFSSCVAPPMFCVYDDFSTICENPLRFKSSLKTSRLAVYILDCIFTVCVPMTAVACVWRGLWNLLDLYLYANDPLLSMQTSLIAGYTICVALVISREIQVKKFDDLVTRKPFLYFWSYSKSFIQTVGCVLIWRGMWDFYNIYVVFDMECLSEWVTSSVGIFGGLMIGCISSFCVKLRPLDGILLDGWPIKSISRDVLV